MIMFYKVLVHVKMYDMTIRVGLVCQVYTVRYLARSSGLPLVPNLVTYVLL